MLCAQNGGRQAPALRRKRNACSKHHRHIIQFPNHHPNKKACSFGEQTLLFILVNDALFGVLIKDVHSCNFKSNLDGVAGTSGRTGGNTSGESLLIGNEVQIDFSTH